MDDNELVEAWAFWGGWLATLIAVVTLTLSGNPGNALAGITFLGWCTFVGVGMGGLIGTIVVSVRT